MGTKLLFLVIIAAALPFLSGKVHDTPLIKADKHKIYLLHPTPEEQRQAEQNCKSNPNLMGCGDKYYY